MLHCSALARPCTPPPPPPPRFLEAPVAGSQQLSNDGMLVILAAGDRSVYEDCSSCFQAMGKSSFFLGTLTSRVARTFCRLINGFVVV